MDDLAVSLYEDLKDYKKELPEKVYNAIINYEITIKD